MNILNTGEYKKTKVECCYTNKISNEIEIYKSLQKRKRKKKKSGNNVDDNDTAIINVAFILFSHVETEQYTTVNDNENKN